MPTLLMSSTENLSPKRRSKSHMKFTDIKEQVSISKVIEIDLNKIRPQRAGVVFVYFKDGEWKFGLGIDSRMHELTDFGGHVNYKYGEDAISGALRELDEETLHLIERLNHRQIANCLCIYDSSNLIIFIRVDKDPDQISARFLDKFAQYKGRRAEVCGITWITLDELERRLKVKDKQPVFYSRVHNFLARAGDFWTAF